MNAFNNTRRKDQQPKEGTERLGRYAYQLIVFMGRMLISSGYGFDNHF